MLLPVKASMRSLSVGRRVGSQHFKAPALRCHVSIFERTLPNQVQRFGEVVVAKMVSWSGGSNSEATTQRFRGVMLPGGGTSELATPQTNAILAESVATLVTSVRLKIALSCRHVRGHTGIHGNEVADQLADRGAAGRVSPRFVRWTQPPEGPMGGVVNNNG